MQLSRAEQRRAALRQRRVYRQRAFAVVVLLVVLTVLFLIFGDEVLTPIFDYMNGVDDRDPGNVIAFFFLLWLTVLPVVPGYAIILLGIGFVYGWWGLPLAYIGSVTGGWFVFGLSRYVLAQKNHITYKSVVAHPFFAPYRTVLLAVEAAIAHNPHKIITLSLVSFLPYGLMLTILGLTDEVNYMPLMVATLISRLKVIPYIWLASTARRLVDLWERNAFAELTTQDLVILAVSGIGSIAAILAITVYAQQELERQAARAARGQEMVESESDSSDEYSSSASDSEDPPVDPALGTIIEQPEEEEIASEVEEDGGYQLEVSTQRAPNSIAGSASSEEPVVSDRDVKRTRRKGKGKGKKGRSIMKGRKVAAKKRSKKKAKRERRERRE